MKRWRNTLTSDVPRHARRRSRVPIDRAKRRSKRMRTRVFERFRRLIWAARGAALHRSRKVGRAASRIRVTKLAQRAHAAPSEFRWQIQASPRTSQHGKARNPRAANVRPRERWGGVPKPPARPAETKWKTISGFDSGFRPTEMFALTTSARSRPQDYSLHPFAAWRQAMIETSEY